MTPMDIRAHWVRLEQAVNDGRVTAHERMIYEATAAHFRPVVTPPPAPTPTVLTSAAPPKTAADHWFFHEICGVPLAGVGLAMLPFAILAVLVL
jgi:hypothetical protein